MEPADDCTLARRVSPCGKVTLMVESSSRGRSNGWLWIILIWCTAALFDASQTVIMVRAEGRHHPWLPIFETELVSWLPWVLATPLIIFVARRYASRRGHSVQAAAAHALCFLGVMALASAWSAVLEMRINPWEHVPLQRPFVVVWRTAVIDQIVTFAIVYALIVTITLVIASRARIAHQSTEAARLNEQLSIAQLAALRRQMEPHFMFNTLNSITALVRDHRNDDAVRMIVGLSEFLRRASEDSHGAQVALSDEVEYLQRYIDIQKVRFGDRINFSVSIPPQLMQTKVPTLFLQPLVENAIKHGITKRVSGGAIRVTGSRLGDQLQLCVYNDGPTLAADWQATGGGIGIENLRTRLAILYPGQCDLLLRVANGGAEVVVTLPLTVT